MIGIEIWLGRVELGWVGFEIQLDFAGLGWWFGLAGDCVLLVLWLGWIFVRVGDLVGLSWVVWSFGWFVF